MVPSGHRLSAFVQTETRPGPRNFFSSLGFPLWLVGVAAPLEPGGKAQLDTVGAPLLPLSPLPERPPSTSDQGLPVTP